jgi:hypothetical protein
LAQQCGLLLLFSTKLPIENNRPRGKKSPNLVTLTASLIGFVDAVRNQSDFSQLGSMLYLYDHDFLLFSEEMAFFTKTNDFFAKTSNSLSQKMPIVLAKCFFK